MANVVEYILKINANKGTAELTQLKGKLTSTRRDLDRTGTKGKRSRSSNRDQRRRRRPWCCFLGFCGRRFIWRRRLRERVARDDVALQVGVEVEADVAARAARQARDVDDEEHRESRVKLGFRSAFCLPFVATWVRRL